MKDETPAGEVRLALVMNGGVSLAVWMAGVTHEIDLLRRASCGAAAGPSDRDRPVWEAWKQACASRGVGRVVVDVVAGTSAGGLNGTLLATAIARGGSLDPPGARDGGPFLRELWENEAGLVEGQLLRPVGGEGEYEPPSALNGEHFTKTIRKVVADIDPEAGGLPEPVTLFVTATAIGRAERRYQDGFDNAFSVSDHRRVYRFRSDPAHVRYVNKGFVEGPLDQFSEFAGDLAVAARASASYPVAFSPVRESAGLASATLRVLPGQASEPAWLIDGGVLDNAPFGPVLDTITRRPMNGPVRRVLAYVVPSQGEQDATAQPETSAAPEWPKVVGSALGFPREADFRSDVDELRRLLREGGPTGEMQRAFSAAIRDGDIRGSRSRLLTAGQALLPTYRDGRAAGGVWEARTLAQSDGAESLSEAAAPDPPEVLAAGPLWVDDLPDDASEPVPLVGTPWRWGLAAAERVVRLLFRDLRAELDRPESTPSPVTLAALDQLSSRLTRIEAVAAAAGTRLGALSADAVVTTVGAVEAINTVFGDLEVPQTLGTLVTAAAEAYVAEVPGVEAETALRCAFAAEVSARAMDARAAHHRTAPVTFLRIGPDADLPFLAPDLRARVDQLGEKRLYGTRLMHFAAFGRAEWRRWDWLCGRLDALVHLGRLLGLDEQWISDRQREVLEAEGMGLADYRQRIEELEQTDDRSLRAKLAHDPGGRAALSRLVDQTLDTVASTGTPEVVGALGRGVGVVLRSSARPDATWRQRTRRLLVGWWARGKLWGWIAGSGSAPR